MVQHYTAAVPGSNGFLLESGARQAEVDRGLQLRRIIHPQEKYNYAEDALTLLWELALGDGVDSIVTTMHDEQFLEPILAARAAGISVYVVGLTSSSLLASLREQLAGASTMLGPNAASLPDVRALVVEEAATVQPMVTALIDAGIRDIHCIKDDWQEVAFNERCLTISANFSDGTLGRTAVTHEVHRTQPVMASFLRSLQAKILAAGGRVDKTGLVLMGCETYAIVRAVMREQALLEGAHVAVFCASLDVVGDISRGDPVTALDYPLYSQAYAAVALAAYELQTMKALPYDVTSQAKLLTGKQLMERDVRAAACRQDGFPVCGAPGVAEVSPNGCACFNRSSVSLRVLATLPTSMVMQNEAIHGLTDAQSEMQGVTFTWNPNSAVTVSAWDAIADMESVMRADNWTSVLSLDHMLASFDASVDAQMQALGQVLGNRSFWIVVDRDESVGIAPFLQRYNATGYVGPEASAWELLGVHARAMVERAQPLGGGPDAMLMLPMRGLPKWSQVARALVDGYFHHRLSFPDGFWAVPVVGDPAGGTGVWSRFYDEWTAPTSPNATVRRRTAGPDVPESSVPVTLPSIAGSPIGGPIGLQLRPAPPLIDSLRLFEDALRGELAAGNGSFSVVVIQPSTAQAAAVALKVLEDADASGQGSAQLLSLMCRAPDLQAMRYPDSMEGGHRSAACVDWQTNLAVYTTFLAEVLRQQTGESLFVGEVATGRLITRNRMQSARMRRAADCIIYHESRNMTAGVEEQYFPVCNVSAGCGAPHLPCSGHGRCQFPTPHINAASPVPLAPSDGWCVCDRWYEGALCDRMVPHVSHLSLRAAMLLLFGLLLALLLLAAVALRHRVLKPLLARATHDKRHKQQAPQRLQPMTVVFTDIEGSTNLWEWNSEIMNECLQIHHQVIRSLLIKHHGYESNTEGDAFELVFHDAADALSWALEAQETLLQPEKLHSDPKERKKMVRPKPWPRELLDHEMGHEEYAVDGSLLYRGLRVRMGIHTGTPESTYQHANGRQRYVGTMMDLAKAIGDSPAGGGQVLMSMDAWAALGTGARVRLAPIVVHNAGEHLLKEHLPPVRLMEVLPQSLRKRAPFPALRSQLQISPGFFEAPCSASYVEECPPTSSIVIMFTFVGGVSRLKSHPLFLDAVALLVDFMRARLCHYGGYECEEKDGNFLLAFADPLKAALFSQDVQVGAMYLPWPEVLLREEAAAEVLPPAVVRLLGVEEGSPTPSESDAAPVENFLFRGLRIKMGLYYGVPARCMPHALTGRASYFGPLMNRSARISTTAANGQTLCNFELAEVLQFADNPHDLSFTSLGRFSLKGLAAPMQIFQVSNRRTEGRSFPRTRLFKSLVSPTGNVEAILTRRDTRDDIGIAIMPSGDISPAVSHQHAGIHSEPGSPLPDRSRRISGNWTDASGGLSRQSSFLRSNGSSSPASPAPWSESASGRFFHVNTEDGKIIPAELPQPLSLSLQLSTLQIRHPPSPITRQGSMPLLQQGSMTLMRQGSMTLMRQGSGLISDSNTSTSPPRGRSLRQEASLNLSHENGSARYGLRSSLDTATLPLVAGNGGNSGATRSGSDTLLPSPLNRSSSWQMLSRFVLDRPFLKNLVSKKVTPFVAGHNGSQGGGVAVTNGGVAVPQRNVFQELVDLRATIDASARIIQELRARLEGAGMAGTPEGPCPLPCEVPLSPQVAIDILEHESSLDSNTELLPHSRESAYLRPRQPSEELRRTPPERTSEESAVAFFSNGGRASNEAVGLYDPSVLTDLRHNGHTPVRTSSTRRLSTSFLKLG